MIPIVYANIRRSSHIQAISKRVGLMKHKFQFTTTTASLKAVEYLCVHVFVTCKKGTEEAFKIASIKNATASAREEGVARFDVIQQLDDPCKFVLVEVYKDANASPVAHKETEHYKVWRDTVADMMAVPRTAIKYKNIFPSSASSWDYPTPM